jgi:DNA-binding NtrC family response regulator
MHRDPPTALVVDRESDATQAMIAFLRGRGFEVVWAKDGEGAFSALDDGARVDCLISELRAPRIDGMALLARALERNPVTCAVMMTDGPGSELAIEAMRRGAHDFQVRPLHLEKLLAVLERGLAQQKLSARVADLEARLDERFGLERLNGHSRVLQRVIEQVRHIASTRASVLIEGEAGTGKGVVAQAIHQNSARKHGPFVSVDCESVPESLIEGELFGIQPPASAGAHARPGRVEHADGGTLFLDGVAALPPLVQVTLLHLVQERTFTRMGGGETLRADVRLIAATHRDLTDEVKAGRFREDLFYRLGVVRVQMPALRERREDIPLLVDAFVRQFNREHNRRVTGITRGALERLTGHEWPGNVRELKNTVEGMVVFAEGRRPLNLSDLPDALREGARETDPLDVAIGMTVGEAERHLISATLRHTGNDKTRAAAMLGIGLRTLYRKLKQYGMS